ncbi:hypothetical protein J3F83DRAFT_739713 [Trichoderma novae-zelandiae]
MRACCFDAAFTLEVSLSANASGTGTSVWLSAIAFLLPQASLSSPLDFRFSPYIRPFSSSSSPICLSTSRHHLVHSFPTTSALVAPLLPPHPPGSCLPPCPCFFVCKHIASRRLHSVASDPIQFARPSGGFHSDPPSETWWLLRRLLTYSGKQPVVERYSACVSPEVPLLGDSLGRYAAGKTCEVADMQQLHDCVDSVSSFPRRPSPPMPCHAMPCKPCNATHSGQGGPNRA